MKKVILAVVVSAFGVSAFGASAALACDGMKGHAKGTKSDQADTQSAPSAKKDSRGAAKPDQKS
jgi:hypothetical protein